MSISSFAASCGVCAEFMTKKYDELEAGMRCVTMMADVERIEAHVRVAHKPGKRFAFTFTTNKMPSEIQTEMIDSCHKLYRQQSCPIVEGEAYLEYTKEGRPHIHGWYETADGGRVFAKVFQRCWPYWKEERGKTMFAGGFHEEMRTDRYRGYASAEGRVICLKKKSEPCVYNAPSEESPPQV